MVEAAPFDVEVIRNDFPILQQHVAGQPLVYLDNAATTQKPKSVIDAIQHYYLCDNANVHRGVHTLSERATDQYEAARVAVQRFIHAKQACECIFVRGATEGINLVAHSFVAPRLQAGDEVLITEMEHHSNIVPWQMLCQRVGAKLQVVPISDSGELMLGELPRLLTPRTKFFAIGHVSNALGTVNPIKQLIALAHQQGIPVLVDGAQATAHLTVDVQDLDCDFYVFSGHKMYGPTGIGVVYGKAEHLEQMPPYQGGGEMITRVSFSGTEYNAIPHKFEAGTPNIAGVIGLAAAIHYLQQLDSEAIQAYEQELFLYANEQLAAIPDLVQVGTAQRKIGVFSFLLAGIHANDIGTLLNQMGIAIRSGHHCAMPVMEHFKVAGTARASLALYNTKQEIDRLIQGLAKVQRMCR